MTSGTETDTVRIDRRDAVAIVTLDRPQARNAVDAAMAARIEQVFADIDADPGVAVAVLTGSGGTFSAGADLKAIVRGEKPMTPRGGFAGITRRPPQTPVIAAIEGFAVAGGLELALASDLLVAAEGAKLGLPEVKRGLIAAGGGLLRLPRRIPYHLAMELILTGDLITAERAHELGLVNLVAAPGQALEAAVELAERIAAGGPLSLRASKQVVAQQGNWTEEEGWEAQEAYTLPVFDSDDADEGSRAFAEKREPVWTGR